MKRHLIFPLHFDSRASTLDEIGEQWDEDVKKLYSENRQRLIENLQIEFGEHNFDEKLNNFKELGYSPFSIVSHHNKLFYQARYAFIHGLYYPSLTASCALGERILNHLLLDLRENFPQSKIDRRSHSRSSIDDWSKAIEILNGWKIFQVNEVISAFEGLRLLRNKSLHFNKSTVSSLRDDSLSALSFLREIIDKQFGFLHNRAIPGSKGAFFLQKEAESDPFIRKYYLNQSPYVSPYYMMRMVNNTWLVFDFIFETRADITDEEFLSIYSNRNDSQLASTDIPWGERISVVALTPSGVFGVEFKPDP